MPHPLGTTTPKPGRLGAALLVYWLCVGGCGPSAARGPISADPQDPDRSGYNPARAFVTLDELDATGVVVPQPTAPAKPLSARGKRRIDKATRLYAQQRYTEAGLELDRALGSDPDSYEVHLQLARVLRASGSTGRTRTHLQRALELKGDDLLLHYFLASSALDDEDRASAVRELQVALRCPNAEALPDFKALVLFRLAESLQEEGYLTAALEAYRSFEQAAASLEPGPQTDQELATLLRVTGGRAEQPMSVIYERLGRYDQAADALAGAIEDKPADTPTRTRLTRLLSLAGRHQEAVDQARELVARDVSAVDLVLETYRRAGRVDAALDDLSALAARKPDDTRYLLAYVAALEKLGRQAQAEAELKQFTTGHPQQLQVHWRLFDLYVARSAWPEALSLAAEAVAAKESAAPAARSKLLELPTEGARALLEAMGKAPPSDPAKSYLLGCVALHLDDPQQATALLEQATRAAPDFAHARTELAAAYNAGYRWTETLALLREAGEGRDRVARVELLLGQALDGLDQHEQAAARYNAAARLNPSDGRALKMLARLYERTGDALRAIRQYRAALEADPLDEASREALLFLYLGTGDREAATAQLQELRKMAASPNRVARCLAVLQDGPRAPDFERLRRTLTEAMEASQPDSRSLTYIGITYLNEAQFDQALAALDKAVELDPNDAEVLLARESAYRMTLQFDKAEQTLRALLKRHPHRTEWITGLVDVLRTEQDSDGALSVLQNQLARANLPDEDRAQYRATLLEVLGDARRFDDRIETLKRWQTQTPDDTDLRSDLLEAYLAADRQDDALSLARTWYEEEPGDDRVRRQLVALLVEAGQADRAFQMVLDQIDDDPDNDELQVLLIGLLRSAERYDDALELATNCLAATPDQAIYQELMWSVYAIAGRHDEAVKLLGEMIHQAGGEPHRTALDRDVLQKRLAVHLIQAGRYNQAQGKLTRWIERSTDSAVRFEYLTTLAACHQERGQEPQAIEALEQAYALRPLGPGINNDLAYSWADAGLHLDQAEKMLRYAVAQSPRQDAYLDSLGWVLYKKGDFAGAIQWLTLAVGAGAGDDPVIHRHLGDACWRAGQHERALENWRAAQRFAVEKLADPSGFNAVQYARVRQDAGDRIAALEGGEEPEVAPLGEKDEG